MNTIDATNDPQSGNPPHAVPPAPWTLRGWGFASVHLADVKTVRHLVPPDTWIVCVAPGKTLAALYFASYKVGSTLAYRELAIAVAIVRHGKRVYAWAPQLYVDSPASVAGGRAIWGLHKTLAEFERTRTRGRATATVRADGREIATFMATSGGPSLPLSAPVPVLGMRGEFALPFVASARARARLASATVTLPGDSPYRHVFARRALVAVRFDELALVVPAPSA